MRIMMTLTLMITFSLLACVESGEKTTVHKDSLQVTDSSYAHKELVPADSSATDRTQLKDTAFLPPSKIINTKNVRPAELIAFAKTLDPVPYKYGSTDPRVGFDCSGFITYVFNHFGIAVPRSSIDFTNVGKDVSEQQAKPGDLILFTGTDSTERFVGHMGIITEVAPTISFIHSSSGKANGVVVTPLNEYYRSRFVKIVRIFPEE